MRALLNDVVLADSDDTVVVEGNHYFPPDAVRWEALQDSERSTRCHWKGTARYWSVEAAGVTMPDAAWGYPEPMEAAKAIAGYVAFDRRVDVVG